MNAKACTLALMCLLPAVGHAQEAEPPAPTDIVIPGTRADEHARTRALLGSDDRWSLIRSGSSHPAARSDGLQFLRPQFRMAWNSGLPFTWNDGALWAGRGLNLGVSAGVSAEWGRVRLVLAPELLYIENADFAIVPGPPDRSSYAARWYTDWRSADLPLRFGAESLTILDPGQSSISVRTGPVVIGASTASQWWGPGIRNALVMSTNAPGIPHLFIGTGEPQTTRFGTFEARWMVGGLTESLYFDTIPENDLRALSGAVLTFAPAGEPDLTIGIARAVYGSARGGRDIARGALRAFTRWSFHEPTLDDVRTGEQAEQITSLFARWASPEHGFETYAEWARMDLPSSLDDLFVAPYRTQGYTLGLQWARPLRESHDALRLQAELTNLEQTPTPERPPRTYYTSPLVVQGYTNRGQSIGAAIGPGASSQWLALDYLARNWELGLFGARIRWANDAYYDQPTGVAFWSHDVSVLGGVRGAGETPWGGIAVETLWEKRFNFLFQNRGGGYGPEELFDQHNFVLRVRVTPPARR